jgi:hypothetical protein
MDYYSDEEYIPRQTPPPPNLTLDVINNSLANDLNYNRISEKMIEDIVKVLRPFLSAKDYGNPADKAKISQIFKTICSKINEKFSYDNSNCYDINSSALNLFKQIYVLDPSIQNDISFGNWGTFKRNCLLARNNISNEPSRIKESWGDYFGNKAKRLSYKLTGSRGGKIKKTKKSKSSKSSKSSKRSKSSKSSKRSKK